MFPDEKTPHPPRSHTSQRSSSNKASPGAFGKYPPNSLRRCALENITMFYHFLMVNHHKASEIIKHHKSFTYSLCSIAMWLPEGTAKSLLPFLITYSKVIFEPYPQTFGRKVANPNCKAAPLDSHALSHGAFRRTDVLTYQEPMFQLVRNPCFNVSAFNHSPATCFFPIYHQHYPILPLKKNNAWVFHGFL